MVQPSSSLARTSALALTTVALAGVGAALALRGAGHGSADPSIDAVAALIDYRRVEIRLPEESGPAAELAALRLASAWREFGYECASVVESAVPPAGVGSVITAAPFPLNLPEESKLWASLGIRHERGLFITSQGHAWSQGTVAAAITLTAAQLDRAGPRLALLVRPAGVRSIPGAITMLMGETSGSGPVVRALEALARFRPPVASRVVLWSRGQRVFEAALDESGYAILPGVEFSTLPGPVPAGDQYPELIERAERIAEAVHGYVKSSAAAELPRVLEAPSLEARACDGAVQSAGWYDAASHGLVVLGGIPASRDDALYAFAEAELLRALGPPASLWFARGLAHTLVGSCGGFELDEIESRTGAVTMEEVQGPTRARSRIAQAPAEARLARCLLGEFQGRVPQAWGAAVTGNAELEARLRESWKSSVLRSQARPRAVPGRRLRGGVQVEWKGPGDELASSACSEDLDRIAALGFRGIVLEVHVPVAPPGPLERRRLPIGLEGWGKHVTVEGDAVVLACAMAAHTRGLAVTLAPTFITGESGGPGRRQIHGSYERVRLYGDRRALAMEGVAWLAEQAGAEAIVMFDAGDLPRANPDADPAFVPLLRAARESTRRQSLVYSRPFTGERIAFARGRAARAAALENLASPSVRGLLTGPLQHVDLRIGWDHPRRFQGSGWIERRRVLERDSEESEWTLVGPWFTGQRDAGALDLSQDGDAELRELTEALSEGVAPAAFEPIRPR